MSRKGVSKSWKLAEQLIFTAFQILKEHDGQLQGNQVITQVGQRVALDDWAKARYEKSGYIRWQSVIHFYTNKSWIGKAPQQRHQFLAHPFILI